MNFQGSCVTIDGLAWEKNVQFPGNAMYLFQMSDGMISDIKLEIIIVGKVRLIT